MRIDLSDDLIMDIIIHITILFIFLYIFFFVVISKTAEQVLNSNIKNICDNNINPILEKIDKEDQKYGGFIDWEKVKLSAEKIRDNPDQKLNQDISDYNNYYKKIKLLCL